MSQATSYIDPELRRLLDECGLPWTTENGGAHTKLRIQGRLVGVIPRTKNGSRRKAANLRSAVQRKIRELRDGAKV
jgi:hypothetical protein